MLGSTLKLEFLKICARVIFNQAIGIVSARNQDHINLAASCHEEHIDMCLSSLANLPLFCFSGSILSANYCVKKFYWPKQMEGSEMCKKHLLR